jgi:hypothetical protein
MRPADRLLVALAPPLAALAVQGLGATLRLAVVGADSLAPCWQRARPLIYAVWHGQLLMLPWLNRRLRRSHAARAVGVLASASRDGEVLTRYLARFGLEAVRGSSSRDGARATRALVRRLAAGGDVALAPDGPRGPRGQVQPGVVALAALAGAPIVPIAFGARPVWRLGTWDALEVPAPFARCVAVFGAPLAVARDADRECLAKDLQRGLDEATAAAARLCRT